MNKTQTFSIYLLKRDFNAENTLKEEHSMEKNIETKNDLPEGCTLFVLDNPPKPPWWKEYFGIRKELKQALKAAIVFLLVGKRTFAITFGHARHNLQDISYEYDFGLRVTLNCLDPDKIKSTDVLNPNGAKRQRTQSPIDSDLTFFDFDRDTTILKSLTGKVREEYKEFFKHATGSSNIRITSKTTLSELTGLCQKLLKLYESNEYKEKFPDIQNISPVEDPNIINKLDAELISDFRSKQDTLSLNIPEILDYQEGLWASFKGAGKSKNYEDVSLDYYYTYLEDCKFCLDDIEIEILKRHSLILTDENGNPKGEKHTLYKCLIYDTNLNKSDETYYLCDGKWYLVNKNFTKKLSDYLDPLYEVAGLPDFTHKNEGEYNLCVSKKKNTYLCLDRKNIAPKGQTRVEPCDIFELKDGHGVFHHIKISTRSASLSHLFNQGVNSIQLIRDEDQARRKLKELVIKKPCVNKDMDFATPINNDKLKVSYGIITRKDPEKKSQNLPLFSKISLMRAMRDLKRMGIKSGFYFIKDRTQKSNETK